MKIYTFPEPVLREQAEPVENIDEEIQMIDAMGETMYAALGSVLQPTKSVNHTAARLRRRSQRQGRNFVCLSIRRLSRRRRDHPRRSLLSVIDFSAEVKRHAMVKVRGFDRHGKTSTSEAEGLMAICLQHEIDHLNGKLFIDHISSLKRALLQAKAPEDAEEREGLIHDGDAGSTLSRPS